MRLEGMDAVTRAVIVPAVNIDQTPGKAVQPGGVKVKSSEIKEQANSKGSVLLKGRFEADTQTFEMMFQQQDESISEKAIREAIERANRVLSGSDRKFEISIHEKTKDIMVKVVDTNTNEIIREIPPKKIVDLVVRLCEIAGILFDEKG